MSRPQLRSDHGVAVSHPGSDAAIDVGYIAEAKPHHEFTCLSSPVPGPAVDEIGPITSQLSDPLSEVGLVEVDHHRAREVASREFVGRTDIDDDQAIGWVRQHGRSIAR